MRGDMAGETAGVPEAYVFDLHLLCGGYAYFSTVTLWHATTERGRDVRAPSLTIVANFERALVALGQQGYQIESPSHFERWLLKRGWAVVPESVARSLMPQWLNARECILDAAGTFTDTALAPEGVLKQIASRGRRERVVERERGICLLCGRSQADGVELTMHHVTPYSRGGETTTGNLVLLCARCNQAVGTNQLSNLYQLAGLPHGLDLGLLRAEVTDEAINWGMTISMNLMHTRCEMW